jgi:hypothetical protein
MSYGLIEQAAEWVVKYGSATEAIRQVSADPCHVFAYYAGSTRKAIAVLEEIERREGR